MIGRLAVALLGLLGAGLLLAAPATAHATVVSSSPADGTRLHAAPRTVSVTFDENVGLGGVGYLTVTSQSGQRVDTGAAHHRGGTGIEVALRGGLGDGSYTASFRVVSADSHPVAATIRFVVGNGAVVHGTLGGGSSNTVTDAAFAAARWLSYAGLALLGGTWLLFTVWPAGRDDRRARRLVWTGWGLAVVGAAAETVVQGPYTAGESLSRLGGAVLDGTLHTDYGLWHCVRLVLLGALAIVLAPGLEPDRGRAAPRVVAAALGIGIAVSVASVGHGASTSPPWLSEAFDTLHVLAMAAWLGGLIMLAVAVLPRREPAELRDTLPVFSAVAFASVATLAVTGSYAAWRGVGSLRAIVGSTYGLLVDGKVALLLGILAVANVSRLAVRRRTVAYAFTDALDEPDEHDGPAVERLRRSVWVEALAGLVVLVLSAVLVAEPRGPEALAAADRAPLSVTAPLGGGHSLTVRADPGTHGPVDITVTLDGVSATSVTATATQRARRIGPLPVRLVRRGPGSFDGSVTLPVSGAWRVDLVVTRSAFDAVTTDATLELH